MAQAPKHDAPKDGATRPDSNDPPRNEGVLQSEYDGEAGRDGIPANGTEPVAPSGPEDIGA